MGIRVAKECLIAAYELGLTKGDYVFVAFELDIISANVRQKSAFKWATADFSNLFLFFELFIFKYYVERKIQTRRNFRFIFKQLFRQLTTLSQ